MPAQGTKIYLKVCRLWKDRVTYMKRKIYIHCMALAVIAILETLLLTLGVSYDMLKKQIMEEIRSYAYLISDLSQQEEIP